MAQEFKLPDVGEGLTEAEIVSWKVKAGDTVAVNDIIVEIETAKSLVELPSPYDGTVAALLVAEGETVDVGKPIIAVSTADDPAADDGAQRGEGDPYIHLADKAKTDEIDMSNPAATGGSEKQMLVGTGPKEAATKRRARRTAATATAQADVQQAFSTAPAPAPELPVEQAEESVPAAPQPTVPTGPRLRALAKPPVRKLAKDLGVDLTTLTPSGEGGVVTRADVEAYAAGAQAPTAPPVASATGDVRVPIKGVRKMTAQAMVQSAFTAPHVTEWLTLDVTKTMELVESLKGRREFADVRVSPLLVLAKAVCLAVRRTPELNAAWDDAAQEIVLKRAVNLGIAAATPRGLVVPNIKGADSMSLVEIATALGELVATARAGRTKPAEMSGGSFTITNVGVFGVDAGTPILNPGESGILAFGAIKKQPWVVEGPDGDRIEPRYVTTLALSFDHRIVDGEQGSRFLADIGALLADPATALLY
ncbi:dihydrolipoamide acetyltransferase family protein [Solicola gregarius]|uniref:Dihydrolipoamide acetyltransferase component of pyruvate dehydrogenase complex n=1 Tax=Solicola gregarius TaxID=2908642 RepID=A0AA46TKS8_9ACTN|nr:dihydrolipoamide acetyltransferase family protein [Solicola gregarius]UYM07132.1 2-oxo acid dehydrogenase subunit E2 [Solicola gregarius]